MIRSDHLLRWFEKQHVIFIFELVVCADEKEQAQKSNNKKTRSFFIRRANR
jgi:hypothetical protein